MDIQQLMAPDFWLNLANTILDQLIAWGTSPQFYAQIGAIAGSVFVSWILARQLRTKVKWFAEEPPENKFQKVLQFVYAAGALLFAALCYVLLGVAVEITQAAVGSSWLVKLARGVSVVFLLYSAINRFIPNKMVRTAALWIGIPLATLQVFGYYNQALETMDSLAIQLGNIRVSLLFVAKAAIAGAFFFWLGRISNNSGQKAIRSQEAMDIQTRELVAKLFQIALFGVLFLLLMQVLGIDLTALAILGGAVGVGLGFGLQQIAANFISGMIILFERSLKIGDYIEMDDKAGILKELSMRSSTLSTFDGKEITIPNEKFVTNSFVNWTRDGTQQRYEVEFSVSFDSDLRKVAEIVEKAVATDPRVLMEPEEPDCELRSFGESGVNFAIEFWVDGLDDGPNKFSSDVLFLVWEALQENGIQIPFPQREVRVLSNEPLLQVKKVDRKPAPNK